MIISIEKFALLVLFLQIYWEVKWFVIFHKLEKIEQK